MLDYQLDEQGELQSIIACINDLGDVDEGSGEELKEPTPRSVQNSLVHRRDLVTGALIPMTPMEMPWFAEYCSDRDREYSRSFEKKFRSRFRMPYTEFWKLVDLIKTEGNGYFDRWMVCETNCFRTKTSPLELLLLGTLRYGRMHAHSAFKLAGTARTYNMTVNHRRRILHTTCGQPATWNHIRIIGSYDFRVRVGRFKGLIY
jgi:hypothetical protein